MINVLVTCGGGFQGLTLFKELEKISGLSLYLADINEENCTKYFFDFFVASPPVLSNQNYINFIFQYSADNEIKYIFPATIYDLTILSDNKNKFFYELGCKIIVPDKEYVSIFLDKKLTSRFFTNNNIPSLIEVDPEIPESYPIIGKPVYGWGSKNLRIFYSKEEYVSFGSDTPDEYFWCSYYKHFDEFSIDFSVNYIGLVSEPVIRKRNFVSGGFAVVSETIENYDNSVYSIFESIRIVFSKPCFTGIYNIQVLKTQSGIYVSDVNPRIGTSSVFGPILENNLCQHVISKGNLYSPGTRPNFKVIRYLQERFLPVLNLSSVKGIIFDLDDTLISNKKFVLRRAKLLFERFGGFSDLSDEFMLFVSGLLNEGRAPFMIDEICKHYHLEGRKEEVLAIYRDCFPDEIDEYRDAHSCIVNLNRLGFRCFILTDNPLRTQREKTKFLSFGSILEKVFYTEEMGSEKPSELVFNKVASESGFHPNELIMVGDNFNRDCVGALKSGFAHSFHIVRPDGMVGNSDYGNLVFKDSHKITRIESLNLLPVLMQNTIHDSI